MSGGAGRLAAALVRLYPARWRARYGMELLELVADSPWSARLAWDLLRGAVDAQLNLADLTEGWSAMVSRLRASVVTVLTGWVAFSAAVCALVKGTEEVDLDAAALSHPGVGTWLAAVRWAFGLAGASVLVGAAPLAWAAVRGAWRGRDPVLARLCAVPVLAGLAVVGYLLVVMWAAHRAQGPVDAGDVALFVGLLALCGGGAAATVLAARAALHRIEPPAAALRWAGWAALVVAAATTAGTVSAAGYAIALATEAPALLRSASGLLATPLPATLAAVLALGAAGAVAVDRAAVRGLRALRG